MKHKTALLFALLWLTGAARAQVIPLKAGQSETIRFDNVRPLEKGPPPAAFQNISAQASFALDATGTILTITLQNTAAGQANAVLYALDLGLSFKQINQTRLEASFSEYPDGAEWLGPVDSAAPTAGTGTSTFAAKPAVFRRLQELLDTRNNLSADFLRTGQSGRITLQLLNSATSRDQQLRLEPRLYFLAPDPNAPQTKRLPLAVTGAARVNK
ncbi:MAG: hypothetical protein HYR56_17575 [Acidobacteria bacterium]|nr:hypothetical protein [Acidobacteriota bacterium]MBI3426505.1 hypothetical protein [Acidobacteriota bacterium]